MFAVSGDLPVMGYGCGHRSDPAVQLWGLFRTGHAADDFTLDGFVTGRCVREQILEPAVYA